MHYPHAIRSYSYHLIILCALTLCFNSASSLEIGLGHISDSIDNDTRPKEGNTIRLVAPRGGTATGVIVVRGNPAAAQARLSRDGLRQGRSHNLDDAVQIWYGSKQVDFGPNRGKDDSTSPYYDALIPRPVEASRVLPIYVHISVPEDAQPGGYSGTIEVRGRGGSQDFELQVMVAPFVLPPPQQRHSWVDMLQSPDSVAYRYGVPLYSRQHLQLMRPSLEKMARLGQRVMHVTAIARTMLGNDEAMLPIGERGIDWSGLEGYMALFNETVGAPKFVVVYAVERGGNTGSGDAPPHWTPPGGRRQGSTNAEEVAYSDRYRPAWKAAMEGIQQRIQQAGWDDTEILIGWIGDARPFGDYFSFFSEIAPFARWVQFTHARGDDSPRADGTLSVLGMDVAYRVLPYPPGNINRELGAGQSAPSVDGWKGNFLNVTSMRQRNDQYHEVAFWLGQVPHATSSRGSAYRGVARIGMDFWTVPRPGGGSGRIIQTFQRWNNLQRDNAPAITAPGPEGALPTVRYLAMAQGAQETEAFIWASKALQAGRLPQGANRNQARELLDAWRNLRVVDPEIMAGENEFEVLTALYGFAGFAQGQR
ncbi:MAG: hypothetical protein EA401_12045 [Planctomycetota bacterium]|nr:MAG: hypothetical protein EA401_12045 [Planctomycetota bacterium]